MTLVDELVFAVAFAGESGASGAWVVFVFATGEVLEREIVERFLMENVEEELIHANEVERLNKK